MCVLRRGIGASASEEKAAKWLQEVQNRLGAEEIDAKYDEVAPNRTCSGSRIMSHA